MTDTSPARTRSPAPPGEIDAAFDRLVRAEQDRTPCPPVRELFTTPDVAVGYAVQRRLVERATAAGRRIVGRKVGLTAPAVQAQLGVDQPDFGTLFADMACSPEEHIGPDRLMQPRIEAEIAFVLGADLDGDVTPARARAAVDHGVAALEIVDSRIAGWDITLVDTVADNASCGLYVLGREPVDITDRDLRLVRMTMTDGSGATVSSGTGTDCLGDPVLALAWLARTVGGLGDPLRAGDVVLSGALGPMVAVLPGSTFTADLTGMGSVTATFAPREAL